MKLTPFKKKEIQAYVTKKLASVDVSIESGVLDGICNESEGHPYVLVAMCYLLFDSLDEKEFHISKEISERAKEKIHSRLAQDFFSPMYHPLTPKAKDILKIICDNVKGLDFTFSEAVEWTKMERHYTSPYIQELLRKGILNKPERGRYQLFHRLFVEYVKTLSKTCSI